MRGYRWHKSCSIIVTHKSRGLMRIYLLALLLLLSTQTSIASERLQRLETMLSDADKSLLEAKQSEEDIYKMYLEQKQIVNHLQNQFQQQIISVQVLNEAVQKNNELVQMISQSRETIALIKEGKEELIESIKTERENIILAQITEEVKFSLDRPYEKSRSSSSSVSFSKKACEIANEIRATLPSYDDPNYPAARENLQQYGRLCYLDVSKNDNNEIVAFSFSNDSKNSVNPGIEREYYTSSRTYKFEFSSRSFRDIHLEINDVSNLTGLDSHDNFVTSIIFLPRKNLPYYQAPDNQSINCERKLYLPTGEYIILNALTNEIIEGAISEDPMDMTPSRHSRKFAGINYSGNGIMIRADRRAGTPELNYKVPFNINEKTTQAIVTHKGKECLVPKAKIWTEVSNSNASPIFIYDTDEEFLDEVANKICKWNLTMDDIN